jgi:hypothetical protein
MFCITAPLPLVCISGPIQPLEKMLGPLTKPASVVSQCTAPLLQIFEYLVDPYLVDGSGIESGQSMQCCEPR